MMADAASENAASNATNCKSTSSFQPDQPVLSAYFNICDHKAKKGDFLKKRWIVFNSQECRIYYYRAKGDLVPLGRIDIRRAAFAINPHHPLATSKSSLVFSIVTPDSEYLLEGVDKQTSIYWIKELQRLRRNFVLDIASEFGVKLRPSFTDDGLAVTLPDSTTSTPTECINSNSIFYSDATTTTTTNVNTNININTNINSNTNNSPIGHSSNPSPKDIGIPPVVHRCKSGEIESIASNRHSRRSIGSSFLNRVKIRAESLTRHNSSPTTGKGLCEKCKEKDEHIITVSDDLTAVENELQATREVIHLLQRQLDVVQNEKEKLQSLIKSNHVDVKDQLLQTLSSLELELGDANAKIAGLQRKFDRVSVEKERLSEQVTALTEEVSVLRDTVEAKDKTVINLTNEIFELETNSTNGQIVNCGKESNAHQYECADDEVETLREAVSAYKMQNEFLNQEVVALNELRVISERKQQELQLKAYEWEAKCCQVQSKLLSLLKEMKQSINPPLEMDSSSAATTAAEKKEVVLPESTIDLVKRLLQDMSLDIPLSWQKGNRRRLEAPSIIASSKFNNRSSHYDDLGFSSNYLYNSSSRSECPKNTIDELEFNSTCNTPNATIEATTSASGNVRKSNHHRDDESRSVRSQSVAWKNRWDAFVASLGNQELTQSQELKFLLRSGIPREYRCKIWKSLVNFRVADIREQKGRGYYQSLLDNKQPSSNRQEEKSHSSGTFKSFDPIAKQIELDLLRTLPNNRHFESLESDGTCRLRRVLTAFSRHNPKIGYCQGLNRLAAVSLLFMPEEEAFWALVAIVEFLMPPNYYSHNLLGAHVDQHVFRDLLSEKLPRISEVLEKLGIEISLFSWFLTCFVDNIPVEVYLRIWDVFLYEGNKVCNVHCMVVLVVVVVSTLLMMVKFVTTTF